MDFKDFDGIESDKFVIFQQDDLHSESFPLMKEIRRQGKLCDVTLKVKNGFFLCLPSIRYALAYDSQFTKSF